MANMDKYLDMCDEDIDNLLMGVDLNKKTVHEILKNCCKNCKSTKLEIDNAKGHMVCTECAVINEEFLDKTQEFSNETNGNSRYGCPSNFFFPKSALGTKIQSKGYNRLSLLQKQGQKVGRLLEG